MDRAITRPAPAKINLALHVTGRRGDGYHELDSLVSIAAPNGAAADRIAVTPAATDRLRIEGPFGGGLAPDATNIVHRALALYRRTWPAALPAGVEIVLTKNLPLAAGIGGGSADAAATLRALTDLADAAPDAAGLAELALDLGADVPVCLENAAARVRGIGERVSPLALPAHAMVLANPLAAVGTREVFSRLTQRDNERLPDLPVSFETLDQLVDWLELTRNDLAAAAESLVPAIAAIRKDLAATPACRFARMSGSGATVFGLFATLEAADRAAAELGAAWPDGWVVATPAGS